MLGVVEVLLGVGVVVVVGGWFGWIAAEVRIDQCQLAVGGEYLPLVDSCRVLHLTPGSLLIGVKICPWWLAAGGQN